MARAGTRLKDLRRTADGYGEIPGTGQSVRLLTHGLADAEPVVQDHHAWPRATPPGRADSRASRAGTSRSCHPAEA